jgi:hypothetical protein
MGRNSDRLSTSVWHYTVGTHGATRSKNWRGNDYCKMLNREGRKEYIARFWDMILTIFCKLMGRNSDRLSTSVWHYTVGTHGVVINQVTTSYFPGNCSTRSKNWRGNDYCKMLNREGRKEYIARPYLGQQLPVG